jgi:hypothetical protein
MIRFFLGFMIVFGALGNQDFAMEAGLTPPPLIETIVLSLIGLVLMYFGLQRIKEKYGED